MPFPIEAAFKRDLLFPLVFFTLITVLTVVDVFADLDEGVGFLHIMIEVSIIITAATGTTFYLNQLLSHYRGKIKQSEKSIQQFQQQAEQWREKAKSILDGLALQIDHQFSQWQFTPAEKEVALLLIKGLSQKEIAAIRQVQEKTIRQQATAIYKKSALSGRSELAAFFLEDLLLPHEGLKSS